MLLSETASSWFRRIVFPCGKKMIDIFFLSGLLYKCDPPKAEIFFFYNGRFGDSLVLPPRRGAYQLLVGRKFRKHKGKVRALHQECVGLFHERVKNVAPRAQRKHPKKWQSRAKRMLKCSKRKWRAKHWWSQERSIKSVLQVPRQSL